MTDTNTLNPDIYIPPNCFTLDKIGDDQIRLGLQGPAFAGKTTASLTFPNPIILSYDRKVSAHSHRSDVVIIPFHDAMFVEKIVKRGGILAPVDRKQALIDWLNTEGIKLKKTQTLIIDGSTAIEENFHIWFRFHEAELTTTKKGGTDGYVQWNLAKSYFEELHTCIKALPCNVIYICHEVGDVNDKGEFNGKVRPLLSGQSGAKLGGNLTDLFRARAIEKPNTDEKKRKFRETWRLEDDEFDIWMKSTPATHQSIYLWQTQSDDICICGTSSLFSAPKYILASYDSFKQYKKQK